MRTVLPGKPQAKLQAVCTTSWKGKRIVAYISGNSLVILGGPHTLIQTIYHESSTVLDAVAIDEATAKIAVCSGNTTYIYRPYGWKEGILKWSLQFSFDAEDRTVNPCTLSWGTSEELLVGSSTLKLFQTVKKEILIWSRLLSSPAKLALFSHDAELIASTAKYDQLVKIWRRLSYGSDDVRFDFSYLSHPSTVTGMQWRSAAEHDQSVAHVLYTICVDNRVRIWASTDPHGLQVLQLWADIDLQTSIQPRHLEPLGQIEERYVFFIDAHDFLRITGNATKNASSQGKESHVLEHLREVAARNTEICVILDNRGHMSAWALEKVGNKIRVPGDIINIAHIESLCVPFPNSTAGSDCYANIVGFAGQGNDSVWSLLLHDFEGKITWLEARIDELFDPSPGRACLHVMAHWTGHDGPIKKIVRNVSGGTLISRTNDNEGLIWKQRQTKAGTELVRRSSIVSPDHIHRTCVIDDGDFVANLHHESLSVWDVRSPLATKVSSSAFDIPGKLLCLLQLPTLEESSSTRHLAALSSTMDGIIWQLDFRQHPKDLVAERENRCYSIDEFCRFNLGLEDDLAFVLPIDPAGSTSSVTEFLDAFARDVALSYTQGGIVRTWTSRVNAGDKSVEWLATSTISTGIEKPSLASGSSIRKVALVDASRNGLTIWDSRSGQLEHDEQFASQEVIGDLDWSSTPDDQSILAVGFPHRVFIFAQMRYDYTEEGPAWAPIREIRIRDSTPYPIGDSTWLGNGDLVIGAGNQLFMYDKAIATSDDMISDLSIPIHKHSFVDLFDVVAFLNGPLPLFHPQLLAQCILAGKFSLVQKVIIRLNGLLKFFTEGDELESYLKLSIEDFFTDSEEMSITSRKEMQSSFADFSLEDDPVVVTEELAITLNENLAKISVPNISSREQIHLADIVECVAISEKHQRSMDDNAIRYFVFFRQQVLRQKQVSQLQVGVTWREMTWALHSGSQEILVDLVSRHFQGRTLWHHARESGMFMWMTDITALRAQFEVIARNEYTKTDEKNPIDCSLYYLALKKKNVLLGLWRMAAWNREQSSTQKLLSNNFADPRWKTAALKNAYALLGRRRFEYAAAFFLLAGNLRDAVNVCANQLQDLQLAITIARVYEGDDGTVFRKLLEERVLPLAAFEGNRWLATWAFWMLGRRDLAVRALITPIHTLINTAEAPSQQAKSYLSTDPALVVLYKQLRDKSLQTLKGASQIPPREEWEFVIQTARLYDRMGCDLLALDLVRNWVFLQPVKAQLPPSLGEIPDPRKMMRRRSSLVVNDLPPKSPTFGRKPPPKVFEEPSTNSLLDNFGF